MADCSSVLKGMPRGRVCESRVGHCDIIVTGNALEFTLSHVRDSNTTSSAVVFNYVSGLVYAFVRNTMSKNCFCSSCRTHVTSLMYIRHLFSVIDRLRTQCFCFTRISETLHHVLLWGKERRNFKLTEFENRVIEPARYFGQC